MNFEIPKKWSDLLNNGDLEGVLALYEENALLMATFDAQPLVQPSPAGNTSRISWGDRVLVWRLTKARYFASGSRQTSTNRQVYTLFFMRRPMSLFDKTPVLLLSFRTRIVP